MICDISLKVAVNACLVTFLVVSVSVALLRVGGGALLLVRLAALLHVVCLTFLFVLGPVDLLTDALVGCVALLFVVRLVVRDIHRLAGLRVGHRTLRLVGGLIHRLNLGSF